MPTARDPLTIVSILGTSRPGSLTARVLELVVGHLRDETGIEVISIDPAALALPFPGQPGSYPDVDRIQGWVRSAAGAVVATPEYHGSYAAMLKLVIENLGYPSLLANKPVALVGVAAGRGGAEKTLAHLHGVCQHLGAIPVPDAISVPQVHKLFDGEGRCLDAALLARTRVLAASLVALARAPAVTGAR
ncbi:MAG TPA: NAD(P)H-dependent oxidoreductase [Kofleriaceae bacterium]|nr:NAD(P)H-dependent oxidoreductase [Kofleriaceae bacterium]